MVGMPDLRDRLRHLELPARVRPWVVAALVVLVVVLAVGRSLLTSTGAPVDFNYFGPVGADLLTGRWAGLYRDPVIQAGPLELALWGVPQLIGLSGALPWGVLYALLCLLLAAAITAVVHRVVRGRTPDALPIALLAAVLALATGIVTSSVMNGHPAEVVIPLLWVAAALTARRGHPLWSAVIIAAAAGWEVWGVLGAAVVLLAPGPVVRTLVSAAVGGAIALAALFGPFVALGPFRMFEFRWLIAPNTLESLWLRPRHDVFPWGLRVLQGALSVGGSAVLALLLRRSRDAVWLVPMVASAIRLVLDPLLAPYYFDQPAILVIVVIAVALARRSLLGLLGGIVLLNVVLDLRPFGVVAALGMLVGTAVAAVVLLREARRDGR
jgi:hypothetical protein